MENTNSFYAKYFRESAARIGRLGYSPRLIEGWTRLKHGTLDHLSAAELDAETEAACRCIDADPAGSETLAASYGLRA